MHLSSQLSFRLKTTNIHSPPPPHKQISANFSSMQTRHLNAVHGNKEGNTKTNIFTNASVQINTVELMLWGSSSWGIVGLLLLVDYMSERVNLRKKDKSLLRQSLCPNKSFYSTAEDSLALTNTMEEMLVKG